MDACSVCIWVCSIREGLGEEIKRKEDQAQKAKKSYPGARTHTHTREEASDEFTSFASLIQRFIHQSVSQSVSQSISPFTARKQQQQAHKFHLPPPISYMSALSSSSSTTAHP